MLLTLLAAPRRPDLTPVLLDMAGKTVRCFSVFSSTTSKGLSEKASKREVEEAREVPESERRTDLRMSTKKRNEQASERIESEG